MVLTDQTPMRGTLPSLLPSVRPGHFAYLRGSELMVSSDGDGGYYVTLLSLHCFYPAPGRDEVFSMIGETDVSSPGWELR